MDVSGVSFPDPDFVKVVFKNENGLQFANAEHACLASENVTMCVVEVSHMGCEYDQEGVKFRKWFWKEVPDMYRSKWLKAKVVAYETALAARLKVLEMRKKRNVNII